ncbi:tRNA (N(6)-L-threonylcarbamoyladenosine(37)-C(2))-methylthiotransferase MtaB [Candidatus Azobacteroides pseudotrichonymphae]|uniref:Fe-S oxidoreductase n=1 Tax=Azobacteroides pseudotrichonymphae genomovar. CFP2 TaxID=511995 RepID=B6YS14_AZOPC|nr:tRNA (N(6)-L-threonylcarbamoyladenosine(37)-C(2))-methylthiotransferase MtaB [Candidatus Azobacteroides pseudotrichonymphae]BAG83986.1 putative Fe-S oxidoreductase [Candidatus Azobacteroides pseudotrichonymphae genomovar. CFP2]
MKDSVCFHDKKAAYYTLGCKLNYAETSAIRECFLQVGIKTVQGEENPDIVIISTCSVTEEANKKCRNLIRRVRRKYSSAFLVVTGCYAQLCSEEIIKIEGIDLVVGLEGKRNLSKYVLRGERGIIVSPMMESQEFTPACSYDGRTRSFLKIQDGCDYTCSYCTIPLARGKSRNRKISDLVRNSMQLGAKGVKEIVLTGVNIGDFGKSTGENFLDLLRDLDKVENISRFRISSIEPNLLSDEIIEFVAFSDRFVPHFHIPLQSGSDAVLRLMNRKYDIVLLRSKIEKIKTLMTDAFIGFDIIVGMRGETDEYFRESQKFLESLPFSQLHVFTYSERPATMALNINQMITLKKRQERRKELLALSKRKCKDFYCSQIGTNHSVLFENSRRGNKIYGFTENYIKVEMEYDEKFINQLLGVTLGGWNENAMALTLKL